jgi:hypothetical protein
MSHDVTTARAHQRTIELVFHALISTVNERSTAPWLDEIERHPHGPRDPHAMAATNFQIRMRQLQRRYVWLPSPWRTAPALRTVGR